MANNIESKQTEHDRRGSKWKQTCLCLHSMCIERQRNLHRHRDPQIVIHTDKYNCTHSDSMQPASISKNGQEYSGCSYNFRHHHAQNTTEIKKQITWKQKSHFNTFQTFWMANWTCMFSKRVQSHIAHLSQWYRGTYSCWFISWTFFLQGVDIVFKQQDESRNLPSKYVAKCRKTCLSLRTKRC